MNSILNGLTNEDEREADAGTCNRLDDVVVRHGGCFEDSILLSQEGNGRRSPIKCLLKYLQQAK
jgi:hypothetical protein